MKFKSLLLGSIVLAIASVSVICVYNSNSNELSTEKTKSPVIMDLKVEKGIYGALDYYNRLRVDPFTGTIDPNVVRQSQQAFEQLLPSKSLNITWTEMGPDNIGGRVRAILLDKSNPSIMYAGGVSGGLWKSTTAGQNWTKIILADNIAVSCITQAPDGKIYVGTGEGLAQPAGTNFNSGTFGGGIYESTDGINFSLIPSTTNWDIINRLACDANGKLYAATEGGLRVLNGAAWTTLKPGIFKDVKFGKNSNIGYGSSGGTLYKIDASSGTPLASAILSSALPNANVNRIEIGIAPSDINVAYVVMVKNDGSLNGVYRTSDGGTSWTLVGLGQSNTFNLFGSNKQGWYDAVCMVNLNNPDLVYVGGISAWKGEKVANQTLYNWTQISNTQDKTTTGVPIPYYVHADHHAYVAHPTNPNIFYLGTDGGIFTTSNGGQTYTMLNKNLAITQFYYVACSPSGKAMGGTQDNSTPYLDGKGNSPNQARDMFVGDGGWSAFSALSQKVLFATSQYGFVGRSNDDGEKWQYPTADDNTPEFFSYRMISDGVNKNASFVTPIILWETENFANSIDTVIYIADTNYVAGQKIYGRSILNNKYPFEYTLTQNLNKKDTIKLRDKIHSNFFIGATGAIWMTKQALYYGKQTPDWYKVATFSGTVSVMQISKDGNDLFFAINQNLYRLSNILTAQDSLTSNFGLPTCNLSLQQINSFQGVISSIGIDPSDANKIVVTLGGFTTSLNHIHYSTDALSANPTFTAKGMGTLLNGVPVYASLIPVNHPKVVIVGTEFGIMATEDITAANPVWAKTHTGIDDQVPVFSLTQQRDQMSWKQVIVWDGATPVYSVYPGIYNYGTIYAATHGRGIFRTKAFVGINEIGNGIKVQKASFQIYPNPVNEITQVNYELANAGNVQVSIFDLRGKLVQTIELGHRQLGMNKDVITINSLATGTYIMQIVSGNQRLTQKFIAN